MKKFRTEHLDPQDLTPKPIQKKQAAKNIRKNKTKKSLNQLDEFDLADMDEDSLDLFEETYN